MSEAGLRLTLYTRTNCPLCDEALDALARARKEFGGKLEFDVVDIEGDERLAKEYGELIPVVTCGDEVLFIGKVSIHRLKTMLGDAGDRGKPSITPRYRRHLERLAARFRGAVKKEGVNAPGINK